MKIILASGSPRRKDILHELGFDFDVVKPNVNEDRLPNESPEDLCRRLSRTKALSVSEKVDNDTVVIAADTIVVIDGEILGKPLNHDNALAMLRKLEGREHEVITGISVSKSGRIITESEHSYVKFSELTDSEIKAYINTGECDDKAGGYAVQGKGALLIEGIRGDFYNVVGLPVFRLGRMLQELGEKIL